MSSRELFEFVTDGSIHAGNMAERLSALLARVNARIGGDAATLAEAQVRGVTSRPIRQTPRRSPTACLSRCSLPARWTRWARWRTWRAPEPANRHAGGACVAE